VTKREVALGWKICCYCLCDGLDLRLQDKKFIFHNNLLLWFRSFYCVFTILWRQLL